MGFRGETKRACLMACLKMTTLTSIYLLPVFMTYWFSNLTIIEACTANFVFLILALLLCLCHCAPCNAYAGVCEYLFLKKKLKTLTSHKMVMDFPSQFVCFIQDLFHQGWPNSSVQTRQVISYCIEDIFWIQNVELWKRYAHTYSEQYKAPRITPKKHKNEIYVNAFASYDYTEIVGSLLAKKNGETCVFEAVTLDEVASIIENGPRSINTAQQGLPEDNDLVTPTEQEHQGPTVNNDSILPGGLHLTSFQAYSSKPWLERSQLVAMIIYLRITKDAEVPTDIVYPAFVVVFRPDIETHITFEEMAMHL